MSGPATLPEPESRAADRALRAQEAGEPPGPGSTTPARPTRDARATARTGALALTRRITRRSGSNFYYAFLVLPRAKREAIYAVYAIARAIDDAVDEAGSSAEGARNLAAWESELRRLEAGAPEHPVAIALARAREAFPIPLASVHALIEGARMDLAGVRYETFEELRLYCERVASSIGLMCIEIFGYRGARTRDYAVNLGLALQMTNILRDMGTDAAKGRIYLPRADMARFGVLEVDLLEGRRSREVLSLAAFEAARAREFYGAAVDALDPKDRRSLLSAEVMRRIYLALLGEVERSDFDVWRRSIALSKPRRAAIAGSAWLRSWL